MKKIIRNWTRYYADRWPPERTSLPLTQLSQVDWPDPLREWIRVDVERKLERQLARPRTPWVDLEESSLAEAWEAFTDRARDNIRIPAGNVEPLIEEGLTSLTGMLLDPRESLTHRLFEGEDQLDRDLLAERINSLVVERSIARSLIRYMERKEVDRLEASRATRILGQVDEKLTERYTALDWADRLQPLFDLYEEKIPADLIRQFFEHRDRPRLAWAFDMQGGRIGRTELIEILSSPQSIQPAEEEQQKLFEDIEESEYSLNSRFRFDQPDLKSYLESRRQQAGGSEEEEDEPVHRRFQDVQAESTEEHAGESLASRRTTIQFDSDREVEPEPDEIERIRKSEGLAETVDPDKRDRSAASDKKQESGDPDSTGDDEPSDDRDVQPAYRHFLPDEEFEEDEDNEDEADEDEGTIWKQFVEPDEEEEPDPDDKDESNDLESEQVIESEGETRSGTFGTSEVTEAERPVKPEPDQTQVQKLQAWLKDDRKRFVSELFRSSEEAYEKALEDLAVIDNWKEATRYIQHEIFARNRVEMYEEAAVDFTDRLHQWYDQDS